MIIAQNTITTIAGVGYRWGIPAEALTSFQREWVDVWPEVRVYTDYRAMLAAEKPN